jgi:biotin transport system ATP-binding protein
VCWLALLIAGPRTLLLDEPYASLDLPGQARLADEIGACAQQVLVSTHVLEHVRHYPRVLWLEQGRVQADGPGREVCAAYEAAVAAEVAARRKEA